MKPIILCLILVMSAPFASAADGDLYTNVYVVPPTFLSNEKAPVNDPFRNLRPAPPRKTAKEILTNAGITFGVGASAVYNPATSQLIVRNTQDQMGLVEAYIESITQKVEKQIYVTISEVQFQNGSVAENWAEDVTIAGTSLSADQIQEFKKITTLPPLPKPRKNKRATIFDSPDAFRKEFSRPPTDLEAPEERIGRKINGTLTDPQFQLLIRALNQSMAVDLEAAPSVMVRSGQLAMVQSDDRRYGVQAVLGADEHNVDLKVFLPQHGQALFDETDVVTTPYALTIREGATLVIAERRENGAPRFVFVKAQIMDPAGMPFHRKDEKKAKEEKPKKGKESPEGEFPLESREKVKKADDVALRGSQLMANGDYKGAAKKYAEALKILPKHEMTVPRREAYEWQLARAKERSEDDNVFGPGWYETYVVKKGDTLYQIARDMNVSVAAIQSANWLEGETLQVGQEIFIPREKRGFADALKNIIIPKINFSDVPLDDALGQVLVLIHKHADRGLFPNFNPRVSLKDAEKIQNPKITLRLRNVPVSEALRYVTSLAQCQYKVEGDVIIVEPLRK